MRKDDFLYGRDTTSPGSGSKWVTPSNSDDVYADEFARELRVFGAGTVVILGADGIEDHWTFTEDQLPGQIPVAVSRVLVSGTDDGPADGQTTTATQIKAIR